MSSCILIPLHLKIFAYLQYTRTLSYLDHPQLLQINYFIALSH